jgi:hypothetical protein
MRLYAVAGSTEAPTDYVMFTFRLDANAAPKQALQQTGGE